MPLGAAVRRWGPVASGESSRARHAGARRHTCCSSFWPAVSDRSNESPTTLSCSSAARHLAVKHGRNSGQSPQRWSNARAGSQNRRDNAPAGCAHGRNGGCTKPGRRGGELLLQQPGLALPLTDLPPISSQPDLVAPSHPPPSYEPGLHPTPPPSPSGAPVWSECMTSGSLQGLIKESSQSARSGSD